MCFATCHPFSSASRFFLSMFLVGGLLALGACVGGTGGAGGNAAGGTGTWQVTLENRAAGQLTLQVGPPTAAAVPTTAPGFDGTDTFTLAGGASSVFSLPCGVPLAIIAAGGNTSVARTTPSPQNCLSESTALTLPFTAAAIQDPLSGGQPLPVGATWRLTLDNRANFATLTLQISDATETAFAGTPGGYSAATNRFTLAAGGMATASLPCGVKFEIVAGGTARNTGSIPAPQDCLDDGKSATVVLASPTWTVTLDNRANFATLTLQISDATEAAFVGTLPGSYDRNSNAFSIAAGETAQASLACGVAFAITAGGTARNTGSIPAAQDCLDDGKSATVVLASPTWTVTLDNRANFATLTLQISDATEAAFVGTLPGSYDRNSNAFSIAAGETAQASLACGVAFAITAGGTARNTGSIPAAQDCLDDGKSATVVLASPTWTVTLDNRANFATLTLQASDATEAAFAGTPGSYNAATNRFTLAAGGTATANLPCGVNFEIVAGGTARNTGSIPAAQDCLDDGKSATVVLASPTWTVTLDNRANFATLTLQISDATEAAFLGTLPGSYDRNSNAFSIAAGETAQASLACGVAFAITAGGTARNTGSIPAPQDCLDDRTSRTLALSSPTWTVTLDNRANFATLTLQASDATEAAFAGTPGSYNAATNRFTLAAGGTATANLPCGVNFEIVAGGTARNTGSIPAAQDCLDDGKSATVVLASPTWTVTLDNRANFAALTLQISDATEAAFLGTLPGSYDRNSNAFSIAAGETAQASLACGVAFAITAGGTARNTGSIPAPQDCLDDRTSRTLALSSPTWIVLLSNPTAAEFTLQVHSTTAAALVNPPQGFAGTFTLRAGADTATALPCGVDFQIIGSTATNPPRTIPSPARCLSGRTGVREVFTDLPLLTNHTASAPFDLAAGRQSKTFHYTAPTAYTQVFATTSGAGTARTKANDVELRVVLLGNRRVRFSDTGNQGPGRNAALTFFASVARSYAITVTNGGDARASGLTVKAGTIAPLTTGAKAVAISEDHACFLLNTSLSCVGVNRHGQLGASGIVAGDWVALLRPVSVPGTGVSTISAGNSHTCALNLGGSAYCWGDGGSGRLGHNIIGSETEDKYAPTQVEGLTAGATAISAGEQHTCAIHMASGNAAAKCWGLGNSGRLGHNIGPGQEDKHTPTQVEGLTAGAMAISAGAFHTCAIHMASGNAAAKCWGLGNSGRLGHNIGLGHESKSAPTQVEGLTAGVTAISVGEHHTCAIHVASGNAAAKCWGFGGFGSLGNGSLSNSNTPLQVTGLTAGVSAISAGNSHTCAIHDEDTSSATNAIKAKCWGYGTFGQLGRNSLLSNLSSNSPVDVSLPGGFEPASLSQGYYALGVCAMSSSGHPLCWGAGHTSIVGDRDFEIQRAPVQVYDTSGF